MKNNLKNKNKLPAAAYFFPNLCKYVLKFDKAICVFFNPNGVLSYAKNIGAIWN